MAKTVYLESGSYKIKVADASNKIELDSAETLVKGNLTIEGTTTTVESTVTTITDNVITLNSGEAGPGINSIKDYRAGIEIDRGTGAQKVFFIKIKINFDFQIFTTDNFRYYFVILIAKLIICES